MIETTKALREIMEEIVTDCKWNTMPAELEKLMDRLIVVLGVKTKILMHDTQLQMMAAGKQDKAHNLKIERNTTSTGMQSVTLYLCWKRE